ncbi:DNA-protecting protein DprA [Comamonas piscis]|uniref:DNA-protecting protein DprA n=1 Tax=Comamonas piscis TaxID=1562974 RepID=A0A7G5EDH4_9BURK|nr:DNA-processing protein DprA [Comamonas piscis]QMV72049.1 DNA-protecting protein DprA [Comamonas piscis]WSO34794.1 DNA-processing protein DprA [Comamonas piscis]
MTEQELHDWLRLTATPGLGNTAIRRLLARFGLPGDVLAQSATQLESCITTAQAHALLHPSETLQGLQTATWTWLSTAPAPLKRHVLTLGDADYPAALLETADPPVLLYITGNARWFGAQGLAWPRKALAMVGSRNPTPQGAQNARAFAQALVRQGVTVVSGLALGIDAAAHAGALEAGTAAAQPPTIAVIGTGIDRVYPRANHALTTAIAEQGWIVSEYHLGTPPLAQNFPKRNRLISGLASGTLVVEAATASGSLVTARMASEQGREVFAIPGSIHAPQSKGCHALIRQGAKLVESVEDILEELPALVAATTAAPAMPATETAPSSAAPEEPGLLQALGFDPVDLDTLCNRTGIDIASLQIQLLELELKGQVARLPGGLFQRLAAS